MYKEFKYSLFFYFFISLSFAQQPATQQYKYVGRADMAVVFKKINDWFINTPTYTLSVTHASFEDHKTPNPAEKSTGYFKKENSNYHSFLIGVHTIQNKKYKIVVDSSQKIILVSNPDKLIWNNYAVADFDSILQICSTIKVFSSGQDKLYRLDFNKESTIAYYEFLINTEGMLKEIVWYYNKEMKIDEDDENSKAVKPRVSISFSNYNTSEQLNYNNEFEESNYFTIKDNKFIVSEKYKMYKLFDQRYQK